MYTLAKGEKKEIPPWESHTLFERPKWIIDEKRWCKFHAMEILQDEPKKTTQDAKL